MAGIGGIRVAEKSMADIAENVSGHTRMTLGHTRMRWPVGEGTWRWYALYACLYACLWVIRVWEEAIRV